MKEYIEKESAENELNRVEKLYRDTYMSKVRAEMVSYCCEVVKHLPVAYVVEVRHGRWEHNDDGYGCEDLWWCSACKEKFVLIEGTPRDNGYYYCPHCGAKMDGGADE